MKRTFEKIHQKMRLATVLHALALGTGAGLLTAAISIAAQKIGGETPQLLWIALPAGVVLLIAAGIFLLIARPNKKRTAKVLDQRLALGEKVQTMVEFSEVSGDVAEIQREDTKRILAEAPAKKLRNKRGWMHGILPILAAFLLIGSLLMPIFAEETPPEPPITEDTLWSLTDWHIAAVRELIESVRASEMNEDGKDEIIAELELLLVKLKLVTTRNAMKEAVFACMTNIDGTVDDINTFTVLVNALENAGNAKVAKFAQALGTPSDPIIESKYAALKVSFLTENIKSELFTFSQTVEMAADSAGVNAEDALYIALKDFASSLSGFEPKEAATLSEDEETEQSKTTEAALTYLFEGAAEQLSAALDGQNKNRTVSDNAINTLMTIFGISYSELPEELRVRNDREAGSESGDYEEKEDDILNAGGLGGGEILYGSDDAIYYPTDDEYVRYGEVIDEYNGKKTEILEDGGLSDALKDFIDRYFAGLYNKNEQD